MSDMESESQNDSMDLQELMLLRDELMKRLKSCESKMALMSVERNSLWKSIRECNQNLNQVCEHEWGRDYDSYDPYSPLKCRICGIEKP